MMEIHVMMAAKIKDYHKGAEIDGAEMTVVMIFRINAEDTKSLIFLVSLRLKFT